MVIVRQGPLSGAPYHVQDRQVGGTDQNASGSAGLFTKRGDDITRFRNRSKNNLTNGVTALFGGALYLLHRQVAAYHPEDDKTG